MPNIDVTFEVTLALDEGWVSNHTREELIGFIRDRLNTSLGFRGQIKKFKVVNRRPRAA